MPVQAASGQVPGFHCGQNESIVANGNPRQASEGLHRHSCRTVEEVGVDDEVEAVEVGL